MRTAKQTWHCSNLSWNGSERQRLAIRADVEETIESEVSAAANTFGLATFGPLVFPPVDVRLSEPPKVLVTSPRDRIERLEDVLIDPGVTVATQERVEDAMMADSDLAALVVDIGGVATYPASIHASGDLRWTLHITAHEWLHHYLFFRPLGRNMFRSHEMQALNETVADLAAQEISQPAYDSLQVRLPGDALPPFGRSLHLTTASPPLDMEFDFNSEMRETRLTVDRMLESGDVDGAEEYMESRRRGVRVQVDIPSASSTRHSSRFLRYVRRESRLLQPNRWAGKAAERADSESRHIRRSGLVRIQLR